MSPSDPHSPAMGRRRLAVATAASAPHDASAGAAATAAAVDPSLQRRVFGLAWPVISENFLQTMLGIVDTLLVAQLGTAAIAGVGSALQVMFFVVAALSAMSVGSSVLVAQAVGGRHYDNANLYAKQSVVWSLLLSIPMVIAGLALAGPVLAVFGMAPDVTAIGTDYLRVTMGTVVVLTLLLLGGGVLRGAGDSRTPMIITMIINVVNVVLT
ncbi:MAG: MATE family efflux transporter, partial [Caldilineaceae bacterium]